MHGPTCTFWANLTPFSLQTAEEFECWDEGDGRDFGTESSEKTREAITFSLGRNREGVQGGSLEPPGPLS